MMGRQGYKNDQITNNMENQNLMPISPPQRLAKIKWQCRRGMLELDLVLKNFVEHRLSTLSQKEMRDFELLLTASDPELYALLIEDLKPSEELEAIVALVKCKP